VTLSRLHYRVWAAPEKYSSWVDAYGKLALNPLALKTK
jgi:membrane glycosyltransferase